MSEELKEKGFTAYDNQKARLEERKTSREFLKDILGKEIIVHPGVYHTGLDTELMIEKAAVSAAEAVLEIGCGTGAVILSLADRLKRGLGTDINPLAVKNAETNAKKLGVNNVTFRESDLFKAVHGSFDVVIWNPPYNAYPARDAVDMMFWDHNNSMKKKFFVEVSSYLNPDGRIYFGWADFVDLDARLPYQLASANGFRLRNESFRKHPSGAYSFSVLEFAKPQ